MAFLDIAAQRWDAKGRAVGRRTMADGEELVISLQEVDHG
jgi:hypothetical protein